MKLKWWHSDQTGFDILKTYLTMLIQRKKKQGLLIRYLENRYLALLSWPIDWLTDDDYANWGNTSKLVFPSNYLFDTWSERVFIACGYFSHIHADYMPTGSIIPPCCQINVKCLLIIWLEFYHQMYISVASVMTKYNGVCAIHLTCRNR